MRRLQTAFLAAVLAGLHGIGPAAVQAQEKNIPAALLGGIAGAGSGGYIAISLIVAESRAA